MTEEEWNQKKDHFIQRVEARGPEELCKFMTSEQTKRADYDDV